MQQRHPDQLRILRQLLSHEPLCNLIGAAPFRAYRAMVLKIVTCLVKENLPNDSTRSAMLRAVPGFSVTDRDHATLLGSPIGAASGIQDTILKTTKTLQLLRAHDAFCLLRNALTISKMLYILSTSPCFLVPALNDFDSLLRTLLGTILNVNL